MSEINKRNKILITDEVDSTLAEGLRRLGYEVLEMHGISYEEVISIIKDYYGIIVSTRLVIDANLISQAPKLRWIARAGSGMETIDVEYATSKEISCINSPEGNANAVGEHCVGMLLSLFHNIQKSFSEIREGNWLTEQNHVHELEGKNIGIIGYGNTGKAFARLLSSFNAHVMTYDKYLSDYSDQYATESGMEELYDYAEIVSMHVPLTMETRGMVNENFLNRFQKNICFINTSRGQVVKHHDLLQAIHSTKVMGAALDVYEMEDFGNQTIQEKELFQSLIQTGKVLFTPHIAGKSFESRKKIAEVLLKKIAQLPGWA